MPKFELTWSEKRRVVIEAVDEAEAFDKLNDNGEDDGEYLYSTDYSCRRLNELNTEGDALEK